MSISSVPPIDLVVLTYNREDTLGESLSAVSRWQINKAICVDHYSTDRSVEIFKKYFPHGMILYEKGGLGYARTIAIENVASPFFFFLDSDVVVPQNYLERLSNFLGPKIGAIQGKRSMEHEFWGAVISSRIGKSEFRVMKQGDRPFTGATLVRTEAARGADLSRYRMWEDYFLLKHMQSKGYEWLEVFIPVQQPRPKVTDYGNLGRRSDETEGAAMRLYGVKTPAQFFSEQLKFTLRDLFVAIKLGSPKWISYTIYLHKCFVKGYLIPQKYMRVEGK